MDTGKIVGLIVALLPFLPAGCMSMGCTAESTRQALAAQERADEVSQAVVDNQSQAMKILLFQSTLAQLEQAQDPKHAEVILNEAWNQRDLFEFWMVQWERAKALRLVGATTKLWSDQSTFDLLCKSVQAKVKRAPVEYPSTQPAGVGSE